MVTLSGAGGLVWELLWQHHTALALGASALGAAITLASLMAGFALGGLWAARLAKRGVLSQPLRAYAVAEVIVGLGGLVVPSGIALLARLDSIVFPMLGARAALGLQLLGTATLLLVPSAAMGATIPLLSAAATRARTHVAALYAMNTFGAVLGIVLATFALLPLLGVRATGAVAAGLDLAAAAWALRIEDRGDAVQGSDEDSPPGPRALALALLGGMATFLLEVAWFRSLRAAFQSTTETFAILLASFLLPLAIGAALAPRLRRWCATRGYDALTLAVPLAALAVLLATPAVDHIDRWTVTSGSFLQSVWRFGLALLVLGAPVTLLGIIFPSLLETHRGTVGAGRLYAANTAGAVLGALGAGFALLPAIGATRTSWSAAAVLLVAAALWSPRPRALATAALLGLAGLAVAVGLDDGAGRRRIQGVNVSDWGPPLFHEEGPDSTVSVAVADGVRKLVIDGFDTSGEGLGEHYMPWMGHLPSLATPRLQRALVICFGTGQTADAVRAHRPGTLDIVDLNRAVLRAAPLFASNHGVLDDPSVRATVMDGRAFLRRRTRDVYDVVTLEPMAPNFAGTNNLYSREFYQLVRSRLSPSGVVAQWVPFHLLTPDDMTAVIATFHESFPHTRLWIDPISGTGILVGGIHPWRFHPSEVKLELDDAAIAGAVALGEEGVRMLSAIGEPITDDNQRLAYGYQRLDKVRYGGDLGMRGLTETDHAIIARIHALEVEARKGR